MYAGINLTDLITFPPPIRINATLMVGVGKQRACKEQAASCARFNNFLSYQLTYETLYSSTSISFTFWCGLGVELEPVEPKREKDLRRDVCQFYALFLFLILYTFLFTKSLTYPSVSYYHFQNVSYLLCLFVMIHPTILSPFIYLILLFVVGLGVVQFLSRSSRLISGNQSHKWEHCSRCIYLLSF
jgi:hypothetical protein